MGSSADSWRYFTCNVRTRAGRTCGGKFREQKDYIRHLLVIHDFVMGPDGPEPCPEENQHYA